MLNVDEEIRLSFVRSGADFIGCNRPGQTPSPHFLITEAALRRVAGGIGLDLPDGCSAETLDSMHREASWNQLGVVVTAEQAHIWLIWADKF